MLFRCIRAELIKLRRSFIWIVFLILPVISAVMGCFNYLQNLEILTSQWYSLWTQVTLFYSNFFFPPLIAVYCSYLWRLENFNHNRNALFTSPIPISTLYMSQFLAIAAITLATQLWIGCLYLIIGLLIGLPGLPPAQILFWLLRGCIGGLAIAALQLLLSAVWRSFALPIAIALLAGVFGVVGAPAPVTGLLFPVFLHASGHECQPAEDMLSGQAPLLSSAARSFLCSFLRWESDI